MAYTDFEENKPVASDTGLVVVDNIRNNLMAMRDAVVAGTMYGWDFSKIDGTGTADQPQYMLYTKGVEIIRLTFTWGTTGGADGNPTQIVYEYSANSGTDYDAIGTLSFTYDTDSNLITQVWS